MAKRMTIAGSLALVAALLVGSISGHWPAQTANADARLDAATVTVNIVEPSDDYTTWGFDPATVTISAGDTVRWVNQGKIDHTIWTNDQAFRSDIMHAGDAVQYTFASPGAYDYLCGLHPTMKGTVVVQ